MTIGEGQQVVVVGNPIDGLAIFGPFENGEEAMYFADNNDKAWSSEGASWWLTELRSPNEEGYGGAPGERPYVTESGRVLTNEDIRELAAEAEQGYDPEKFRQRERE